MAAATHFIMVHVADPMQGAAHITSEDAEQLRSSTWALKIEIKQDDITGTLSDSGCQGLILP
jgi:hypothetical protein